MPTFRVMLTEALKVLLIAQPAVGFLIYYFSKQCFK